MGNVANSGTDGSDDARLIVEYAKWLAGSTLKPSAQANRLQAIRAFHRWLAGRTPLLEVTHADLVLFTQRRPLAASTVEIELSRVRGFFKWALSRGHLGMDATKPPATAWLAFDGTESLVIAQHLASMERRGLRPGYITDRRDNLARMRRTFGRPLLEASRDDLAAWYAQLAVSAATRGRLRSHAKEFYGWAMLEELIEKDPTLRLERPRRPPGLPRPMPNDHVADALSNAPPRVRQILYLAAFAGLRGCEISMLRREDITDDVIFVRDGKGGRQRLVPIAVELAAALDDPEMPRAGWLFPKRYGRGHLHRSYVCQLANGYLHERGITHTLHTLRHWFATNLYRNTKDLRTTQELLGHASPATTAVYTMLDTEVRAAAVATLRVPR